MILLDTNILIRMINKQDIHASLVEQAITKLQADAEQFAFIPQNVYEFWATATRPKSANGLELDSATTQQSISLLNTVFTFLPDRTPLFDTWYSLVCAYRTVGKVSHDTRLVAAMINMGSRNFSP